MADSRKLDLKGVWIPIVFFFITLKSADPHTAFAAWLRSVIGDTPTESGRRYLISFVAMGVGAAIGLSVILALSAFTWRRWLRLTQMGLFVAFVALCPQIVQSAAMLRRCLLVIDSHQADSIWQDTGLNIRSHEIGAYAGLIICTVLCCAAQFYEYRRSRTRRPKTTTDVPHE